jgi:hypothetical protein
MEPEPDYAPPHSCLGVALYLSTDREEAIGEFRQAEARAGGDFDFKGRTCYFPRIFRTLRGKPKSYFGSLLNFQGTTMFPKLKMVQVLFGLGRE